MTHRQRKRTPVGPPEGPSGETFFPCFSARGVSSGRLASYSRDRAGIEKVSSHLRDCDSELVPEAAFQAAVILRAAEYVADQIAKRG